jgi:hypothetical protein
MPPVKTQAGPKAAYFDNTVYSGRTEDVPRRIPFRFGAAGALSLWYFPTDKAGPQTIWATNHPNMTGDKWFLRVDRDRGLVEVQISKEIGRFEIELGPKKIAEKWFHFLYTWRSTRFKREAAFFINGVRQTPVMPPKPNVTIDESANRTNRTNVTNLSNATAERKEYSTATWPDVADTMYLGDIFTNSTECKKTCTASCKDACATSVDPCAESCDPRCAASCATTGLFAFVRIYRRFMHLQEALVLYTGEHPAPKSDNDRAVAGARFDLRVDGVTLSEQDEVRVVQAGHGAVRCGDEPRLLHPNEKVDREFRVPTRGGTRYSRFDLGPPQVDGDSRLRTWDLVLGEGGTYLLCWWSPSMPAYVLGGLLDLEQPLGGLKNMTGAEIEAAASATTPAPTPVNATMTLRNYVPIALFDVSGPYLRDAECTMGVHCIIFLNGTWLDPTDELQLATACGVPPTPITGFAVSQTSVGLNETLWAADSGQSAYVVVRGGQHWTELSKCTGISDTVADANGIRRDIAVTCCAASGAGERNAGFLCTSGKTWLEAKEVCEASTSIYNRLCTQAELEAFAGEGTGCAWDDHMIWSSTPCNLESPPTLACDGVCAACCSGCSSYDPQDPDKNCCDPACEGQTDSHTGCTHPLGDARRRAVRHIGELAVTTHRRRASLCEVGGDRKGAPRVCHDLLPRRMQSDVRCHQTEVSFDFGVATGYPHGGAGKHMMCWGGDPRGDPALFTVNVGVFTLNGPDLKDYRCTMGLPCVVQVNGTGLTKENSIVLMYTQKDSPTCESPRVRTITGFVPVATVVLGVNDTFRSDGSNATFIFGTAIGFPGFGAGDHYRICWGAGVERTRLVDLGEMSLAGVNELAVTTDTGMGLVSGIKFDISLTGHDLYADDRVNIVDASIECGTLAAQKLDPAFAVLLGADGPEADWTRPHPLPLPDEYSSTTLDWRRMKLSIGSTYRACWRAGIADEFNVDVGTFVVRGPNPFLAPHCLVGSSCRFKLTGELLQQKAKVVRADLTSRCLDDTRIFPGDLDKPFRLNKDHEINFKDSDLLYGGQWILCYQPLGGSTNGFRSVVGVLTVQGVAPLNQLYVCSRGVDCKVNITGMALSFHDHAQIIAQHDVCGRNGGHLEDAFAEARTAPFRIDPYRQVQKGAVHTGWWLPPPTSTPTPAPTVSDGSGTMTPTPAPTSAPTAAPTAAPTPQEWFLRSGESAKQPWDEEFVSNTTQLVQEAEFNFGVSPADSETFGFKVCYCPSFGVKGMPGIGAPGSKGRCVPPGKPDTFYPQEAGLVGQEGPVGAEDFTCVAADNRECIVGPYTGFSLHKGDRILVQPLTVPCGADSCNARVLTTNRWRPTCADEVFARQPLGGTNVSLNANQSGSIDQTLGSDGAVAGEWQICYCTHLDSYDFGSLKCDRPEEYVSTAGRLFIRGLVGAVTAVIRSHLFLPPEFRSTMFLELTETYFQASVEELLGQDVVSIALTWVDAHSPSGDGLTYGLILSVECVVLPVGEDDRYALLAATDSLGMASQIYARRSAEVLGLPPRVEFLDASAEDGYGCIAYSNCELRARSLGAGGTGDELLERARLVPEGVSCTDDERSIAMTSVEPEYGEVLGSAWAEVVVLRLGVLPGGEYRICAGFHGQPVAWQNAAKLVVREPATIPNKECQVVTKCIIGHVHGIGLRPADQIFLRPVEEQCGEKSDAGIRREMVAVMGRDPVASLSAVPQGSYRACYCPQYDGPDAASVACSVPEEFFFDIMQVNVLVAEPLDRVDPCIVGQHCRLHVPYNTSDRNTHAVLLTLEEKCGHATPDPQLERERTWSLDPVPFGGRFFPIEDYYADLVIFDEPGEWKLCYCVSVTCGAFGDFVSQLGFLLVYGPSGPRSIKSDVDRESTVRIFGAGLTVDDQIVVSGLLSEYLRRTGHYGTDCIPSPTEDIDVKILSSNGTDLVFNVTVPSGGVRGLCWCPPKVNGTEGGCNSLTPVAELITVGVFSSITKVDPLGVATSEGQDMTCMAQLPCRLAEPNGFGGVDVFGAMVFLLNGSATCGQNSSLAHTDGPSSFGPVAVNRTAYLTAEEVYFGGLYEMCFCPRDCSDTSGDVSYQAFRTRVGVLTVAGPIAVRGEGGKELEIWVSVPFTLEVQGVGLRPTDGLFFLFGNRCNGTGHTEYLKGPLTTRRGRGGQVGSTGSIATSQIWPDLVLSLGGEYIICWCDNSTLGCATPYAVAGLIHARGPIQLEDGAGMELQPTVNVNFTIQVRGYKLMSYNRMRVLEGGPEVCLEASPTAYWARGTIGANMTHLAPIVGTSGDDSTQAWPGGILLRGGRFTVCWCAFDCDRLDSFVHAIGTFFTHGPHRWLYLQRERLEPYVHSGGRMTIQVLGTRLHPGDEIRLVSANVSCGTPEAGNNTQFLRGPVGDPPVIGTRIDDKRAQLGMQVYRGKDFDKYTNHFRNYEVDEDKGYWFATPQVGSIVRVHPTAGISVLWPHLKQFGHYRYGQPLPWGEQYPPGHEPTYDLVANEIHQDPDRPRLSGRLDNNVEKDSEHWSGLSIEVGGTYRVCWCGFEDQDRLNHAQYSAPTWPTPLFSGCKEGSNFRTDLFTFEVGGPSRDGQNTQCAAGFPCTLPKVIGHMLGSSDSIVTVPGKQRENRVFPDGTCGDDIWDKRLLEGTSEQIEGDLTIELDAVDLPSHIGGIWQLCYCWRDYSKCDDDFDFLAELGELFVTAAQNATGGLLLPTAGRNFTTQLVGSELWDQGYVRIVDLAKDGIVYITTENMRSACDNQYVRRQTEYLRGPQRNQSGAWLGAYYVGAIYDTHVQGVLYEDENATGVAGNTDDFATSRHWDMLQIHEGGTYVLCWCEAQASHEFLHAYMHSIEKPCVHYGVFVVNGPQMVQNGTGHLLERIERGHHFGLQIGGVGLDDNQRIRVVEQTIPCSTPSVVDYTNPTNPSVFAQGSHLNTKRYFGILYDHPNDPGVAGSTSDKYTSRYWWWNVILFSRHYHICWCGDFGDGCTEWWHFNVDIGGFVVIREDEFQGTER